MQVTQSNIHIPDSYRIQTREGMKTYLKYVKLNNPNCNVWKRPMSSLIAEWRAHNLLYKLGLFRSRTKDVDLNYPMKWYVQVVYYILGI